MTRKNIGANPLFTNNNIRELSEKWKLQNSYGGAVIENNYRQIDLG